jgi:hypothetical protein
MCCLYIPPKVLHKLRRQLHVIVKKHVHNPLIQTVSSQLDCSDHFTDYLYDALQLYRAMDVREILKASLE